MHISKACMFVRNLRQFPEVWLIRVTCKTGGQFRVSEVSERATRTRTRSARSCSLGDSFTLHSRVYWIPKGEPGVLRQPRTWLFDKRKARARSWERVSRSSVEGHTMKPLVTKLWRHDLVDKEFLGTARFAPLKGIPYWWLCNSSLCIECHLDLVCIIFVFIPDDVPPQNRSQPFVWTLGHFHDKR